MATIQWCIRSRKFKKFGKISLLFTLLGCFIWRYIFTFPEQESSENIDPTTGVIPVKPLMGSLNIHIWRNVCGSHISQLRQSLFFPRYPDEQLKKFIPELQTEDDSENYGQRIFGFIHPPNSLPYRFAIASDDTSELWLSLSEDPTKKQLKAQVFSEDSIAWTNKNVLDKYPGQISEDVNLFEGDKYYFEVLHKQGIGSGFVQVYWKSSLEDDFKLISSEYLSTYPYDILLPTEKKHGLHIALSGQYQYELEKKSQRISKEYLSFYSLPFIPKSGYLPSCEYKSSYLLRQGIYPYEGVKFVPESIVYPEDDTTMGDLGYIESWPNKVANKDAIQTVVDKLMTSLRLETST